MLGPLEIASRSEMARSTPATTSSGARPNLSAAARNRRKSCRAARSARRSANEFHSPVLPHLGASPHQNRSDLRGALHVRSPARLQVRALNLNRAQNSRSLHFLAHSQFGQLFRSSIARRHRPVFKNHLVRRAFRPFQNFVGRFRPSQINRAIISAPRWKDTVGLP